MIDHLESLGVEPNWCIPTSDESILLEFEWSNTTYTWELESDGDIGVMVKSPDGAPEYLDLTNIGISRFFAERCYEVL
jgi:hypothetical protein